MKIIVTLLVMVVVFCGWMMLDKMRQNAKSRKSLRARIAPDGSIYNEEDQGYLTSFGGEMSPRAQAIAGFMRGTMGVNIEEAIRKTDVRFARAGIESPDAPVYYLFFQRVLVFPFAFLGVMLLLGSGLAAQSLGVLILVIAFFGPKLYLQNKIDHRAALLQRAFPDTLDLLLICVESGLALDAALNRVCNELGRAYPEMTSELNRTRIELALLNDRVKALMNLGDRTGMVAFRSLVVALVQSERFGTSLTDTLRVLSEDFRLQRLANAEAKAARLPVLLTIPLIFLLMPAFMMIVLGPAIVRMVHSGEPVTGQRNK